MPFDGIFTHAMVWELGKTLQGGRINRIYQPYKNELVLQIRSGGQNHKLLISAHPTYARTQLTNHSFENPNEPPLFCMMLRKQIEGAVIEQIKQIDMDRIIIIELKARNEIGDLTYKQLIIEIMGRHSNIVLVDKEKQIIIDCIKHISSSVNSFRTILPGAQYIYPPAQHKLNPLAISKEEILKRIDFNSGKLSKQIVEHFSGISPLLAEEIVSRSGLANRETLPKTFIGFMSKLYDHQHTPAITSNNGKEQFHLFPLTHLSNHIVEFNSLSDMLDRFYFGKADRDRVKQQANDLERLIKNEKNKNELKIKKLKKTLRDSERADEFQLLGELLTANLHLVKRGMKQIEVINYYDENSALIEIQLNAQKTPAENAQAYFSKYQKAKNARVVVKEQIELTETELHYFEGLTQQLESASPRDLEEIRDELIEEGYLRHRSRRKTKRKSVTKPVIETYQSADGTVILVGKNNKQNDYLTTKLAARDNIWLHTKDIPGSHVVIKSSDPAEETIKEAAIIAAYYSKARNSASVPVDFTKVRYVKKPKGAKPGFVIYDHQQTIFVTPNEDDVLRMKV